MLTFSGLGVSVVFDDVAWIGIAMMLTGLTISLSLLWLQWRSGRPASSDPPDPAR